MPKKKAQNTQKVYCERCQRVGHLAKDCYTLMCDYCAKIGHDIMDCRTFEKDRKFIIDTARLLCKTAFAKSIPGECSQDEPSTSSGITSSIGTDMSTLSTVGAYRDYLMSPHKDIIEISTPEFKGGKAKMMVGINCPITMVKIGKLNDNVPAAKEVLTLEDAYGARVKTICLICLSIHVNNKTVLHPCRVISDDFYIETDGVLGNDFIAKSKVTPEEHIELAGIQIPLMSNQFIRGVLKVEELIEISHTDSDSETLTESN